MPGLWLHEAFLVYTFILLLIERVLKGDYYFARSYFSGPILVMGFALVLSWIHGMYIRQQFTAIYEAHESILIIISFFIIINIFRTPEERNLLMVMFFFAMVMKAADSTWVKFFSTDDQKGWGTVLMWRDGFLLGMGIVGTLILAQYRGKKFRWLRTVILLLSPLLMYGLIVSYRRTFILAFLVSAVLMFITMGRARFKRQVLIFLIMITSTLIIILLTDPIGIIARIAGAVFQPQEEGSSYIRLMEYPNILLNIYHNPIFGVPVGVEWYQYYKMPLWANYSGLGCHNTYLYWQLRTGIIGMFGFLWFLARVWKAIIVNLFLQKTEEDFLMNQLMLHSMVLYNIACSFGLMYADAMSIMTSFILIMLQLQMIHSSGLISYKKVNLWQTLRQKRLIIREPVKLIVEPA